MSYARLKPGDPGSSLVAEKSRYQVRRVVVAASLLAGFGIIWALVGIEASSMDRATNALTVVVAMVILGFVIFIDRLWSKTETLSKSKQYYSDRAAEKENMRIGRRFGLVVTFEVIAIVAAIEILRDTGHTLLIAPITALIVGSHFLLLAPLFRVRLYDVTGIVMILLAAGCATAVIVGLRPSGASLSLWPSLATFGSVTILWASALWKLVQGYGILRHSDDMPQPVAKR
ncbi:MAG TPA: hypothetical protein VH591_10830 [Ktedonobacterales bacterium]|jgi:hypothetical protein